MVPFLSILFQIEVWKWIENKKESINVKVEIQIYMKIFIVW